MLLPFIRRNPRERLKVILEILIVMISAGLYLWNFILEPIMIETGTEDLLLLAFSTAYPLFDMLLLLALLVLVFRSRQVVRSASINLLMIGTLITIINDTLFSVFSLQGIYETGLLLDYGYLLSYLCIGMAGLVQVLPRVVKPQPFAWVDEKNTVSIHRHLTVFMLVAAFVLLLFGYNHDLPLSFPELSFWVGSVIILSLIVQLIDAGDIFSLNLQLQQLNQELEQRVELRTQELAEANQSLKQEIEMRTQATHALQVNEALYRAVVEDLPVFICRFTADGTLTFVNEAYCSYFNVRREDLIGCSFFNLIPEEDRLYVRNHFTSLNRDHPMIKYEHRVFAPNGEIRWQRWIDRAIIERDFLIEYQSIGEDITEQRQTEEALRESEEKFRDLFDNSTNLIQIVSPEGQLIFVNQAWKQRLGYRGEETRRMSIWETIHPESVDTIQDAFWRALAGEDINNLEAIFLTREGESIYTEGNLNCKFKNGKIEYLRGIFHDITERRKAEEQLIYNAYFDSLTGLPNRANLLKRLIQVMEQSRLNPRKSHALLFLDIDNFKLVNDSLGHSIGDALLVAIAERLKGCTRAEDTIARLGGDEFIILLESVQNLESAQEVAQRVVDDLHQPFAIEGHEITSSASVGLILCKQAEDAEGALCNADIAMYRAKKGGKNRFEIFDERHREDTIVRLRLENDLRHAIENQEFSLVYQPIYMLENGQVTGLEALLRWNHPMRGIIPPIEFIPIAEETNLIIPIGEWVLVEASRQVVQWQRVYPQHPPIEISVNISPRQLADADFPSRVRQILQESGLPAENLALEITETAVMENLELSRGSLQLLHELGVQIHIDDFGTGYSSFSRLQSFPINTIKIDRSFIRDTRLGNGNAGIVRAITSMSKELGVKTIAEGIEDLQQLETLKTLGCAAGQGFYLAKPMSVSEIELLLRKISP
jgi:diguanylate cyclase (GGDEF)-like protein/PAS domain S-box-containing protein